MFKSEFVTELTEVLGGARRPRIDASGFAFAIDGTRTSPLFQMRRPKVAVSVPAVDVATAASPALAPPPSV